MVFPMWEHLNQCSNHHLCPSSLEYLVICLPLYSNPHGSHGNARREASIPHSHWGQGSSWWKEQKMMAGRAWLFQALMCFITCTIPEDINISKLAWWHGHCEMAASCQDHKRWDLREGFAASVRKSFMSKRTSVKELVAESTAEVDAAVDVQGWDI